MAMKSKKRTLLWKFIIVVLFLVAATHAMYSGADHYWPLNDIGYSHVYDMKNPYHEKWQGTIKGDAEMKWFPPQLALDLYGRDAWIDLGWRKNSCYVDVEYCNQTGLTVAFWVAFREDNTTQGLIEFGNGDCGLNLVRSNNSEIYASLKSVELNKTWIVESVNASIGDGTWHHVTLTWNYTGEVYLFINGTRLENIRREVISNVSCANETCTCDWSMKVGIRTQASPLVQSYSSLKLSRLVLWHYALNNEAILQLSSKTQGMLLSNRGCFSSWIANLRFCYHINSEWKQTWYEARKTCDSYLGSLVSIGGQEEYDFLEEAFSQKDVASCLHIGLQNTTGSSVLSWVDGNVGSFSKLNTSYEQDNRTNTCVHRNVDGLWYFSDCSVKCGFVCKKYRDNLFRNAEFHCRVRRYDHQLVNHRVSIRWVQSELACAVECLIYGWGCRSYNYKHNYDSASRGQNICELSRSNQEQNPESLIRNIGFQYCERVS